MVIQKKFRRTLICIKPDVKRIYDGDQQRDYDNNHFKILKIEITTRYRSANRQLAPLKRRRIKTKMNLKKKNLPVHFLLLQVKMAIFICKRKQEIRQPKNKKKIQSEIASQDSEISLAVHVLEIQKDTYLKLACSLNLEMAIKIMKRKEQVTEFPQGLY